MPSFRLSSGSAQRAGPPVCNQAIAAPRGSDLEQAAHYAMPPVRFQIQGEISAAMSRSGPLTGGRSRVR
jgi:hypothetical protein